MSGKSIDDTTDTRDTSPQDAPAGPEMAPEAPNGVTDTPAPSEASPNAEERQDAAADPGDLDGRAHSETPIGVDSVHIRGPRVQD